MNSKLYISIGSFFKVHLLLLPLIASSIWGGYFVSFLTAYISALIHEFGHIVTAKILGVKISHIEILPFGICGRLKEDFIKNPNQEIMIALSGPIVSFFIAFFIFICNKCISIPQEVYNYIFPLNLLLGVVNLIPAIPLDGGRVLRAYLTKKLGIVIALRISLFISLVVTGFIICLSVYGLLTYSFNFSLILISSFLLGSLCVEQRTVSKAVLSEILNFRDKLDKNDFSKATVITANNKTPARKILKKLSYDRYHIIYVTDESLNIKRVLTEGQIISALTERGITLRLDEI